MNYDLRKKRILVTGGSGFLGVSLVRKIKERGCRVFSPHSKDYDLVGMDAVKRLYKDTKPDIVIHLAARVGGIGVNRENPGKFFYDNLMMGVQMIEEGKKAGIEKFVALGTICCYPKYTHALQGGRSMGWLSRGDKRALWHGKEDAFSSVPGLQTAIRT
jgi:GDP-L-fucose synthase